MQECDLLTLVPTDLAHPLLQGFHQEPWLQIQLAQQGGEQVGRIPADHVVEGSLAPQHQARVQCGDEWEGTEGPPLWVPPGHTEPHQLVVQSSVLRTSQSLKVQVLV